jgi:dTMP kinase
MSPRGKLITLEGVDGAGKSTHLQFIADTLGAGGRKVVVTREPGGTPLAEKLRKRILEEPMAPMEATRLIFEARKDHVAKVIRPALEQGSWVLCDRFTDATIAYQGAGQGVPLELIERMGMEAHSGLVPDRTLLFDCPPTVSTQRLITSGKTLDRFETQDRDFFERVRNAYLARAKAEPGRIRVIDATKDPAQIRKALEKHLAF